MYAECLKLCGNKEIELSEAYNIGKLTLSNGKVPNMCCRYQYFLLNRKG
jgi:hypothetical protein